MADTGVSEARFDIGAVISRAFGTIGSNLLLFCGLALVFAGTPQFILEYWQLSNLGLNADLSDGSYIFTQSYWSATGIGWLVSVLAGAILQSALIRATVMNLSGEVPQFSQCLRVGIALILPMVAISLLATIGVMIGLVLLLVPGIVLALVWSVAGPAYVQEKIGIFEAFGRSAALTSGVRWRILLVMVIVVVLLWVLSIPVSFITAAISTTGFVPLIALVGAASSALGNMIYVTVQASIYVELRQLKEGIAPAELEAIFA
jgi:hypothetical protein